jgi:octaprenyl-diphosphate synthase
MTVTVGATQPHVKKPRRPESSRMLATLYAPIADELAAVEAILRRELSNPDPFVDELARHGFRLGGKRLRPALLLLAAKAVGEVTPDHLTLAAVIEMIHTATLVHDDVLDEATLRRHQATVNARWDNEASVLLGDYLFTHAFYLASTTNSTFACRTIGRATNITCEGEMRQLAAAGQLDLGEQKYLAIIEAKTAELCSCACRLGAHYAGAETQAEDALARYGRSLGVAFQITDDLLDLVGTESATGKSLGTDLEKRKATLPLIHLLHHVGSDGRAAVDRIVHDGHKRTVELIPWLERCG